MRKEVLQLQVVLRAMAFWLPHMIADSNDKTRIQNGKFSLAVISNSDMFNRLREHAFFLNNAAISSRVISISQLFAFSSRFRQMNWKSLAPDDASIQTFSYQCETQNEGNSLASNEKCLLTHRHDILVIGIVQTIFSGSELCLLKEEATQPYTEGKLMKCLAFLSVLEKTDEGRAITVFYNKIEDFLSCRSKFDLKRDVSDFSVLFPNLILAFFTADLNALLHYLPCFTADLNAPFSFFLALLDFRPNRMPFRTHWVE
jgi:hypothetical protein